ncbi:class III extradiol ring-cleavage dioxygenase [Gallaecimonas sp. GXIMD4217]|uniref:DODA-type extradiol aromatic ring-opening family dioxygenase n=1 Tax=Gallaecimonas sp. GXIMD4217 TaxID=3131927 RepID=UPI00311AF9F6
MGLIMLPGYFISHGSPMLALETGPAQDFLKALGHQHRPRAILVLSAHWQSRALQVTRGPGLDTLHDFHGFPDALYRQRYPASTAPSLVDWLVDRLGAEPVARGLDHGAWVPLSLLYPGAEVPVVQLSLPAWSNQDLYALGNKLQPLREQGVLVLASGSITHNLAELGPQGSPTAPWAAAFANWVALCLESGDRDALLDWQRQAPEAGRNHPTVEHFQPLLVAMGLGDAARRVHRGFSHANLAMDCYRFD